MNQNDQNLNPNSAASNCKEMLKDRSVSNAIMLRYISFNDVWQQTSLLNLFLDYSPDYINKIALSNSRIYSLLLLLDKLLLLSASHLWNIKSKKSIMIHRLKFIFWQVLTELSNPLHLGSIHYFMSISWRGRNQPVKRCIIFYYFHDLISASGWQEDCITAEDWF